MTSTLASQSKLADLTSKFDGKTPGKYIIATEFYFMFILILIFFSQFSFIFYIVRIHFLDNSSKVFLAEKETTVKDIILQCLQKCGIAEPTINLPYFGLFESKNGGNIDNSLNMEMTILEIINNWNDLNISQTAKFLFMIRLFMPCLWGFQHKDIVAYRLNKPKSMLTLEQYFNETEVVDVNILHLQFIQAVYNIITGRYPTTLEQALELGAIHFLFKFHIYESNIHRVGFLGNRIVEFIPIKHLRNNNLIEIEKQLFNKIQEIVVNSQNNHINNDNNTETTQEEESQHHISYFKRNNKIITSQCKYMELIYSMENIYSITFFRCQQHCTRILPETLNIGIFHLGINIYDKSKKLIRFFHIEDIYRWGFKPNLMFYFEISEENDLGTSSLEFDTIDGKIISDLLTDYAMAFLKEREREDERHEEMKNGQFEISKTHSRVSRLGEHSQEHSSTVSTGRGEYSSTVLPPPPGGGRGSSTSSVPPPPGTKAPHRAPAVRVSSYSSV